MINRIKILVVIFSMFLQNTYAQNLDNRSLDSLNSIIEKVMDKSNLQYSFIGSVYFLIFKIENTTLKNTYVVSSNNNSFDSVPLNEDNSKLLQSNLPVYIRQKKETIIAPFVFIEDPKRGPNGNILYYDSVLNNLFFGLYYLTKGDAQNIILPLSSNIKQNVIAH